MIRLYRKEDAKRIVSIYNFYICNTTVSFEEEPLSETELSLRFENILKYFPILVYEEEGEVLGYAYLDRLGVRSAYRKTVELSIYVDSNHLKKGIGKRLLDAIEAKAVEAGYHTIVSIVVGENKESIAFHLRNGYVEAGNTKEVGFKCGRYLDTIYLQKMI